MTIDRERARRNGEAGPARGASARGSPQRVTVAARAPSAILAALTAGEVSAMQRSAGNRAVGTLLQRDYKLREYPEITPAHPFTDMHFRFDTHPDPEKARPHEHVHLTIQDSKRTRVVHHYYDSWAGTWRRTGPARPRPLTAGELALAKAATISWAEDCARRYGTQFRAPAQALAQKKINQADFVPLGTLTEAQLAKAAKEKTNAEATAERKRLAAEETRTKVAAEKAKVAAEKAKREQARTEGEDIQHFMAVVDLLDAELAEEKTARDARIEVMAFDLRIVYDLTSADARMWAADLLRREEGIKRGGSYTPMSAAAAEMYG